LRRRERFENIAGRFDSHALSHRNVLERGYALVRDAERKAIVSAAAVADGALLAIEFADGEVAATVGKAGRRAPRASTPAPAKQGKLL
jgi:exodeoxyribonuclease VII large subunit